MKIIGIESASMVASVAVVQDDLLLAEYSVNHKKTHSQTLLPMLDEIVRMLELDLADVDAIAVSGGPGSFTGLRIGSATAKGMGLALQIPLIHIPTLDAMAYQFPWSQGLICPMLDAKRGQVFTGLYRYDKEFQVIKPSCAVDLKEWLQMLEQEKEPVLFLGDGAASGKAVIEENFSLPYLMAPPHMNRERASAVAALGLKYLKEGRTCTAAEEAPEYLRVSQAERVRAEKLQKES